ncbi:MAG: right-handed parallel beta-helix repeat-containing protein, partial [Verrucomicrobiales bacterium]|nr:right-handed parallel beta-helix repeat-containing protein [Verrucomicrobiales bacterium]
MATSLVFLLFAPPRLSATPANPGSPTEATLTGPVQGTLGAGTYRVLQPILVPCGERLSLEPGCVLVFEPDTRLDVEGHIEARGTEEQPVVLRSAADPPRPGQWGGVRIHPSTNTSSTLVLDHCIIHHATTGLSVSNRSSTVRVRNSVVAACSLSGITLDAGTNFVEARLELEKSRIHDVGGAGIFARTRADGCEASGLALSVDTCTFEYNGDAGVRVHCGILGSNLCSTVTWPSPFGTAQHVPSSIQLSISNSVFTGNRHGIDVGSDRGAQSRTDSISLHSYGTPRAEVSARIVNNLLVSNREDGIRLLLNTDDSGNLGVKCVNNTVVSHPATGISYSGAW